MTSDSIIPKLSVVIPCYNAVAVLGAQLNALVGQSWQHPWEIVLVDNGSTDGLREFARHFEASLPHLRVISAPARKSQAYALNAGIAEARSMAVAICDADDEVASGWVQAIGEALQTHEAVAGRIDTRKLNPAWLQPTFGHHPQEKNLQTSFYPPFFKHAGSGNFGVRRNIHTAIGGFDESIPYLFDTEYCWRLHRAGVPLHYCADALLYIRLRSTLRGIYAQSRNWSQWEVLVAHKAQAMPWHEWWRWRAYVSLWIAAIKQSPALVMKQESRALFAWRVGRLIGRARGALRFRCAPLDG